MSRQLKRALALLPRIQVSTCRYFWRSVSKSACPGKNERTNAVHGMFVSAGGYQFAKLLIL
jgi:hypothetical protein